MAKHCIKKGEEILDCYGQHHLSHSKADREKIIQNAFMFSCQCQVRLEVREMARDLIIVCLRAVQTTGLSGLR